MNLKFFSAVFVVVDGTDYDLVKEIVIGESHFIISVDQAPILYVVNTFVIAGADRNCVCSRLKIQNVIEEVSFDIKPFFTECFKPENEKYY